MKFLCLLLLLSADGFPAQTVSYGGSVRAADQFVPGATVTATQGSAKVIAYTDDAGRFTLKLAPGVWNVQVDMFGFTPVQQSVTLGDKAIYKDWTLEMPRLEDGAAAPAAKPKTPQTQASGRTRGYGQRNRQGQGAGERPAFSRNGTGQNQNAPAATNAQ